MKMLLSQRYLQMVKVLFIFFLACFATCQESENKRSLTEHQFMSDRGKALQELKRLMWLQNLMMGVHTASDRGHIARSRFMWTSPKNPDLSDFYNSMGKEEMPNMIRQLLLGQLEESPLGVLRKENVLQYLKNVKDRQDMEDFADLFEAGDQDVKRDLSTQT
ncbi:parathyroid hormone 4-like [Sceloporus undulatus]|uniref:parathyroid hormone 4-like n=1 Tax=Sceloporus undulatus TaxID=8520 RepID=UPI001C4A9560|nr:parathyroid hormone 4-like [Sceloporus undulatus]